MRIPEEVLKPLINYCKENNIGLGHIYDADTEVAIIVAGPRTYGANQISLVAAGMLIGGVLTDGFSKANETKKEEEEEDKKEFDPSVN